MNKSKVFAVLGILIVLVGLLYAGPSILQIYMGGTGQSSFSAGVLRSSGTALSSSELSGDATTSGSNAVTLASVVTAGSCGDTTHSCGLTYDAKGRITVATNNVISGGGGGGGANMYLLESCSPDTSGNIWWTAAVLTNWRHQHWEWNKSSTFGGTDVVLYCSVKLPHTSLPSGTPKIVLDLSANDSTASHTMTFKTCDVAISTAVDVGSLTCQSTQNFTTTTTAYAPSTLTFGVNATISTDTNLVVAIHATAQSSLSNDVLMFHPRLEIQ